MVKPKLMQQVEKVLRQFGNKYLIENKVNKARVIEDIDNYDADLMSAMLNNEKIKNNFTMEIDEHLVFKTNQFIEVFQADEYWEDSYTKYSKKIGLTSNGNFLDEASETVLDFPYKDTVLKASMSKEDTDKEDLKPDEPFLNKIIAREEIDVLLDKKILKNAKRYTADGEEETSDFSDEDNLILKGNNLLALHTLKDKYAGKVKLIYLDPPYNTGNDSFHYNDRFNHSTWLTFMKNRLEVAKELLRDDGLIFIQCDDNEQAYLKVLMDDIFQDGFMNNISVKMSEPSGVKMAHSYSRFPKLKEYILVYNMPGFKGFEDIDKYETTEWDDENNIFLEGLSEEERGTLMKLEEQEKSNMKDVHLANNILKEATKKTLSKKIEELDFKSESKVKDWLFKNSYRIIKTAGSSSLSNRVKNIKTLPNQDIASYISKQGKLFFYITDFNKQAKQPRLQVIFADSNIYKNPGDFWQDIKTTGAISNEGGVQLVNGKKPEKILHRIIKMTTKENDIVLDFFLGSGTTSAVAHKMKRKYIGIEQMDYIEDLAITRLKNVMNDDQTGISKDVKWQGGGSFVYAELMEKNRGYLTDVMEASDQDSLRETFNLMLENADFDFRVDLEEVQDSLNTLSLEDRKRVLVKILDKNQLYYNYSEIDDENVRDLISGNDYEFNKNFYKEDNDE